MRLDRLTMKSQEALENAQRIAEAHGNQELQVEHLMRALLTDTSGIVYRALSMAGADIKAIERDLDREIDKFPKVSGATPLGQIYVSPRLKAVFERAFEEARRLQDEYVSVEHLLIAIIEEGGPSQRILERYGAGKEKILNIIKQIRGAHRVTDQNPEDKYQALQRYSRDLTELARKGKLDPVIGLSLIHI